MHNDVNDDHQAIDNQFINWKHLQVMEICQLIKKEFHELYIDKLITMIEKWADEKRGKGDFACILRLTFCSKPMYIVQCTCVGTINIL